MQKNRYIMSYNFRICLPVGEFRASKVRSIEQSVETETVREGGRNDCVITLVKPCSEQRRLVFERGVCKSADGLIVRTLLGIRQALPLLIFIYDQKNQSIQKTYTVTGWTLVKWSLSDLDAIHGELLLETAEIVYETLTEVYI